MKARLCKVCYSCPFIGNNPSKDREPGCTAGLMRAIQIPEELANAYRTGGFVTLGSSLLILLLGFIGLSIIPLLILVIVLMLIPVFYGLKIWISLLDSDKLVGY